MIAWVLAAAIATLGVQVDAGTLVVAKDGRWTATDQVRIHYKGVLYQADKASYQPKTGEITLAGKVRSTSHNVRIECHQLMVGSGQVIADQARVALLRSDGELLAELRADNVIREGGDARGRRPADGRGAGRRQEGSPPAAVRRGQQGHPGCRGRAISW